MLSRRGFLLSSIGLALLGVQDLPALGKRKPQQPQGYFSLYKQEWPPAIMPDYTGFVDQGYSLFADEFGHLAIVDIKKPPVIKILGELSALAKKVVGFTSTGNKAYALSVQESASGDPQYMLTEVSLQTLAEPSAISSLPLTQFLEVTHVAANLEFVCVGGIGNKSENLVCVYAGKQGRSSETQLLSSFAVDLPIVKLNLFDRHLAVLQSGRSTQLDYVSLLNPASPQVAPGPRLQGDFKVMCWFRNSLMLFGKSPQGFQASLVALKPAPHVVRSREFDNLTAVHDAAAQKDGILLLAESGARRVVVPISLDKALNIKVDKAVVLPATKDAPGSKSCIAVKDRTANVVMGSTSVDVLSLEKPGWKHTYTYAIPRLPASGLTISGDWVVVAGTDLSLYDIANPEKPTLLQKCEPDSAIKCVESAGSFVLCLSKDSLDLRKMEALKDIIASVKLSGGNLAYDHENQTAYVVSRHDQKSTLIPVVVYSNNLTADKGLPLPAGCARAFAFKGHLLVSGVNDLHLYRAQHHLELLCSKHFDNKAIRDARLTEQYAVITGVDQNLAGSLTVLSRIDRDLVPFGSIALPHNAATLAVLGNRVVVLGQTPEGKDLASIVVLGGPTGIEVSATIPVVHAASSVQFTQHVAVIAGRGLEILNLA